MEKEEIRPCGPRATLKNKAFKKEELIQLALDRNLFTKAKATRLSVDELCNALGLTQKQKLENKNKKNCNSIPKDDLIQDFENELLAKGINKEKAYSMTKRALCQTLFPQKQVEFELKDCPKYSLAQLQTLSEEHGIPFPETATKEDKCHFLNKRLNHLYQSSPHANYQSYYTDTCSIPNGENFQMQPHQTNVAKYLIDNRGLLAVHRMGSGKTLTAAASISCVLQKFPYLQVVVFTPAGLKQNFHNTLVKFGIPEEIRKNISIYGFDEYFAFYKRSKELPDFGNSFVIIDEVHNLRSPVVLDSDQKIKKAERAYAIMTAASEAFRVLLLSGSPYVNRVYDLMNYSTMLNGKDTSTPLTVTQFQEVYDTRVSLEDEFKCKVSYYFPPDTKEFPDKIMKPTVEFIMTDDYYSRYKKIEDGNSNVADLQMLGISTVGREAFYSKLRRAVNALDGEYSPKVDWIIQKIIDESNAGRKSLVYSNWKFAGMNLIRKRLDALVASGKSYAKYGVITGDIDQSIREMYRNAFNKGEIHILLISKAGAEGVDLEETRNVILMESNWNPSSDNQIVGRAVRYNSHAKLPVAERNVHIYRLMMKKPLFAKGDRLKSVDEELYEMAYLLKSPEQERVMKRLEQMSIEVNDCAFYFSQQRKTEYTKKASLSKIGKSEKPVSIYDRKQQKEQKYVAPTASGLAQTEEIKEQEYKRMAGIENELEMARILEQMKALELKVKEKVEKTEYAPSSIKKETVEVDYNEDEWM